MRRVTKKIAVAILVTTTAVSIGAPTPSATAFGTTQTVGETTQFDAKPFCPDECPKPAAKLPGTGAYIAR